MGVTAKDLERIRQDGLRALRETLGPAGMIKFIQMYSNGEGDYTEERREKIKDKRYKKGRFTRIFKSRNIIYI